jgi:hypothetical protein
VENFYYLKKLNGELERLFFFTRLNIFFSVEIKNLEKLKIKN